MGGGKVHEYVESQALLLRGLLTDLLGRFYGMAENKREEEMDMREMVEKVKKGESLYGKSTLTPYMQGVAARNSRYAGTFYHVIPWFNFVNHEHVSSSLQPCPSTLASSANTR